METEHRYYSDWNDRESGCSLGLCSCNMTCVWVRRPTHSTSAPTHSLYKSSVPCITHTLREPRALSVSHSSQWRLLTLFSSSLSPSFLLQAGIARFVCVCVFSLPLFVSSPRCLSRGVVVDDINRASFLLTSAIPRIGEESLGDKRITTDGGAREFFLEGDIAA